MEWKKGYSKYREFFLNLWHLYSTKPSLRVYLELTMSLATVAVFAVFAIKPTILTIIELNKEITSKEETVSKLKQKVNNLQLANNILQSEEYRLSLIEQSIPNMARPEILIRQLESLANQNSVQIRSVSVSEVNLAGKNDEKKKLGDFASLPEGSGELAFNFSVTGQYSSLLNLLKNIEGLRRPVKIDSFLFNATVSDLGKTITLDIVGRVPFLYYAEQ